MKYIGLNRESTGNLSEKVEKMSFRDNNGNAGGHGE